MKTNTEDTIEEVEEGSAKLTGVETKFAVAKKMIARLREELDYLDQLFSEDADAADIEELMANRSSSEDALSSRGQKVVEGVFDGQNMIGSDGQKYLVPPNYSSKSKLVEGDILKLTVKPTGAFLFKQIGPIERDRRVGTLIRDEMTQEWYVVADSKKYKILSASVSFFRGEEGDEAAILLPKSTPSKWAALENLIKK